MAKDGYLFIVSMDVQPDKEALFNEVYDSEHAPLLSKVPGVRRVTRARSVPADISIGGQRSRIAGEGMARYVAIYEIDDPEVLLSEAWAKAAEAGRWPGEVRPFTFNRSHVVRQVI